MMNITNRISRLKLILSACALLLLLLIMLLIRDKTPASRLPIIDLKHIIIDGGGIIYEPYSKGRNAEGTPYEIKAATAQADLQDENIIYLTQIKVAMDMETPQKHSEMTAQSGIFQRYDDIVTLMGDIHVRTADGYHIQTPQLKIDFKNDMATTERTVTGQGPMGEMTAGGLTAHHEAGHIYFHKPVKLIIYGQAEKERGEK